MCRPGRPSCLPKELHIPRRDEKDTGKVVRERGQFINEFKQTSGIGLPMSFEGRKRCQTIRCTISHP